MRLVLVAIVVLPAMLLAAGGGTAGDVVFEAGFEGSSPFGAPGKVVAAGHGSGKALIFESTGGGAVASVSLDVEQVRGCTLICSAWVRAERVSAKPQSWNGIKLMMPIESPAGKDWPQAAIPDGSFDWRKCSFRVQVPADATRVGLTLGLEAVSGKVCFDDVRIVVRRGPISPADVKIDPTPPYHPVPRFRGAMAGTALGQEDLRVFGQEWHGNLLRWQLIRYGATAEMGLGEFDAWIDRELARLDRALPWCREYGIYLVIDLHSPPGGRPFSPGSYAAANAGLFTDPAAQAKFVEVWRRIAQHYKDEPMIWGYDLANEPVEDQADEACLDWRELAEKTARAVRAIDPKHAIIVEPAQWGNPQGLGDFLPLDVPGVVYSVHMYQPHAFTHQGLYNNKTPLSYPGMIDGRVWDKAALEKSLEPAIEFQRRWKVPIYIGEFSAIRWAPDDSARRYLSDVIDILEAHGWDWSYHAYREWSGWSVEHSGDQTDEKPVKEPTSRKKLLLAWFEKNRR